MSGWYFVMTAWILAVVALSTVMPLSMRAIGLPRPPPPPPPPPCALATVVTAMNMAVAINAIRIIFFIALSPGSVSVVPNAHQTLEPVPCLGPCDISDGRARPAFDKLRGHNILGAPL